MGQLQEYEEKLSDLGYGIYFISGDNVGNIQKTKKEKKLASTFLSDTNLETAREFGIAWKVSTATYMKMKAGGINLQKAKDAKYRMLPVPSIFIVGMDRQIKFEYVNPDHTIRLDPDVLLDAAESYRSSSMRQIKSNLEKKRRRSNMTAYKVTPPIVGSELPAMAATTIDSKPFDLNKAIKDKPAVLLFYRGYW